MIIWTVDQKVVRGEHPICDEDLKQLQGLGVKTILNLEQGWFESFHRMKNWEFDHAERFAIWPLHLQMGDLFGPTEEDLEVAASVLASSATEKVYVHCLHGVDRTGMVVATYRVKHCGWDPDRAIAEMFERGFHKIPYSAIWLPRLRRFLSGGK